jgi:D-xylose transport system substrate-binding protein
MKKTSLISIGAVVAASALLLTGCSATGGGDSAARACVILPDSESSPRWENNDRPALESALTEAGFTTDIQNAGGDTAKYATIADQQLAQGCGVMVLVDLQGAGVTVAEKAKAQGIPVVAYDRPIAGADFYVSFDNEGVGAIQGGCIVDGLTAAGKDPKTAVVVYIGGDAADGNAKMFRDGAVGVMEAAGIKAAAEPAGVWDGAKSATNFEQALTSLGGKVDAVWAANDPNAGGVIEILAKNGLAGSVPVSGQDATPAGLGNVLLGFQSCTVWKPASLEAAAASEIIIALLKGETPTAEKMTADGVPFVAVTPTKITKDNVIDVINAGDATAADVCVGDVAAVCAELGIK